MYVIVVGLSGAGQSISKTLLEHGHTVVVIDKDEERCKRFLSEYDTLVIHGDAAENDTLKDAGIDEADAVIAAAGDDATNLMVISLAKSHGVKNLVALVRDPAHSPLFKEAGAKIIIPDELISEYLFQHMQGVKDFIYLGDKEAEVFVVKVEKDSKIPIGKIKIPNGCIPLSLSLIHI
ncbi:MAG: TrkA family potassium uptake protein, partial [Nitrososphaerales archaeon]|nr:TrkA family potassium uptake protein [Nitrososphaerales archaeon]